MYPSSPNWFGSRVLAASEEGNLIAFCSKNHVTVFSTENLAYDRNLLKGSYDRINAVAFVPSCDVNMQLVAAGGADKTVRVWCLPTGRVVYMHKLHEAAVTVVATCRGRLEFLVTGDHRGAVAFWYLSGQPHMESFLSTRSSVVSIDIHPTRDICVAGYQNGAITISSFAVDGAALLHKFQGFSSAVQSLCWEDNNCGDEDVEEWSKRQVFKKKKRKRKRIKLAKPSDDEVVDFESLMMKIAPKEASEDDMVEIEDDSLRFCATDRQGNLSVYGYFGNDGVRNCRLKKRTNLVSGGKSARQNAWFTAHWLTKHIVIATTDNGDICIYQIDSKSELRRIRMLQRANTRPIFTVVYSRITRSMYTCSMDRRIACVKASDWSISFYLNSIGGTVHRISSSKMDPKMVAIAAGDGTIRLWSDSSTVTRTGPIFWKGLQSIKVLTISVHPIDSSLLVFGCDDGKVGCLDIAESKLSFLKNFANYAAISHIEWKESLGEELAAYSLTIEGNLYGHGHLMEENATDVTSREYPRNNGNDPDASRLTSFVHSRCGNGDLVLFSLGKLNGGVDLSCQLESARVHVHTDEITSIRMMRQDPGGLAGTVVDVLRERFLVAAGSADASVSLSTCDVNLGGPQPSLDLNCVRILSGHKSVVTELSPSPRCMFLATASLDGLVIIWNLADGSIKGTFGEHYGQVNTVFWSDERTIFSGGQDNTVRCWDPLAHFVDDSMNPNGHEDRMIISDMIKEKEATDTNAACISRRKKRARPHKIKKHVTVSRSNLTNETRMLSIFKAADWMKEIEIILENGEGIQPEVLFLCGKYEKYLAKVKVSSSERALMPLELVLAPSMGASVWKYFTNDKADNFLKEGNFMVAALLRASIGDYLGCLQALNGGKLYFEAFLVSYASGNENRTTEVAINWIAELLDKPDDLTRKLASELYLKVLKSPVLAARTLMDSFSEELLEKCLEIASHHALSDFIAENGAEIMRKRVLVMIEQHRFIDILRMYPEADFARFLAVVGESFIYFLPVGTFEASERGAQGSFDEFIARFANGAEEGEVLDEPMTFTHSKAQNRSKYFRKFFSRIVSRAAELNITVSGEFREEIEKIAASETKTDRFSATKKILVDIALLLLDFLMDTYFNPSFIEFDFKNVILDALHAKNTKLLEYALLCAPQIDISDVMEQIRTGNINIDAEFDRFVLAAFVHLWVKYTSETSEKKPEKETKDIGLVKIADIILKLCFFILEGTELLHDDMLSLQNSEVEGIEVYTFEEYNVPVNKLDTDEIAHHTRPPYPLASETCFLCLMYIFKLHKQSKHGKNGALTSQIRALIGQMKAKCVFREKDKQRVAEIEEEMANSPEQNG